MSGRKRFIGMIIMILALSLALISCGSKEEAAPEDATRGLSGKTGEVSDTDDDTKAEKKSYEAVSGDHLDTVIMIYMIGSNLESVNGCATSDLHEICDAYKGIDGSGTGVKILVQTGGCSEWKDDFGIDPKQIGRYEVGGQDGLILKDEQKVSNMAKPNTLSDFLQWGVQSYPADRYGLILWDHGGGSLSGYGWDENYPGAMMRLQKMKKAFEDVDVHFDFVGFDACLMSTFETAYMLAPFADHLIASEELEPGAGWLYTDWVADLLQDPKMSADKIATQIINDFADTNEKAGNNYTLSLIDLKKIGAVYDKLVAFSEGSVKEFENMEFAKVSKARSSARAFGNGDAEQIDIIDFAGKSDIDGKDQLISAVQDSIMYFKTNMEGANGLAMYYPYSRIKEYTRMLDTLEELDIDQSYTKGMSEFCTVLAQSDKEASSGAGFENERWYSGDISRSYTGQTSIGLSDGKVPVVDIDEEVYIDMTPEQLDLVTDPYIKVWLDLEDHYIELGDDIFKQIGDVKKDAEAVGMASAEYDNSWLMINDQPVAFYLKDWGYRTDGTFYKYGAVPAVLNKGEFNYIWLRVEMLSRPPYDDTQVSIRGYWHYEEGPEGIENLRDLEQLKEGDILEFLCLRYDLNENEEGLYYLNDGVSVPAEGLKCSYETVHGRAQWMIIMDDVYDNEYKSCWIVGYYVE